jgi:glycosyltransferase involved in cell wall biosynthesis
MVALEHAVPVVTTSGVHTEPLFFDGAVAIVDAADRDAFANTVRELLDNRDRREAVGKNGRRLWERYFSWPSIADRIRTHLVNAA